ncbi:MAG TPA: hypothetical protein PK014_02525 [Thermoanaerobaculia bacterium]|nr:hypothetical protein [Thermoanaerobaculia bacterium]HUM28891.1 hypothetical protein [Thermoanaerobaculia bacterium]HXK67176.1 hypothetical protein [Thermoanaerobaculia bacterium]
MQEMIQGSLVPSPDGWCVSGRWFRETLGGRPPRLMGKGTALHDNGVLTLTFSRRDPMTFRVPDHFPAVKNPIEDECLVGGPDPLIIIPGVAAAGDLFRLEGRISLGRGWMVARIADDPLTVEVLSPEEIWTVDLSTARQFHAGHLRFQVVINEERQTKFFTRFTDR